MDDEKAGTTKYNSFGDYCCDLIWTSRPGQLIGSYLIPADAAVRPSLSEFFEKMGACVYNQLVVVYNIPREDARVLMTMFEEGVVGQFAKESFKSLSKSLPRPNFQSQIWEDLQAWGQTVEMPLIMPLETFLRGKVYGFSTFKNALEYLAKRINSKYVEDKIGTVILYKQILKDKNIAYLPAPNSWCYPQPAQPANPAGTGCMLPLLFMILTGATCFASTIFGLMYLFK